LFAIPPKHILDNFSKVITPIFDQMVKNKQENQKLAELRDWLLPMLMNGQVTAE
jgi:type I restriction enzyme S subunit